MSWFNKKKCKCESDEVCGYLDIKKGFHETEKDRDIANYRIYRDNFVDDIINYMKGYDRYTGFGPSIAPEEVKSFIYKNVSSIRYLLKYMITNGLMEEMLKGYTELQKFISE